MEDYGQTERAQPYLTCTQPVHIATDERLQMKESYQKLYALVGLESEHSGFRHLAISHDIEKLRTVTMISSWIVGSPDRTNSPDIVMYSDEKDWPRYQIREVPFLI